MKNKYIVEYRFIDSYETIKVEFDNFIKAMNYEVELFGKNKNVLVYCFINTIKG